MTNIKAIHNGIIVSVSRTYHMFSTKILQNSQLLKLSWTFSMTRFDLQSIYKKGEFFAWW